MLIDKLTIKGYRNYKDIKTDFNTGYNLIIGKNGQGKTNLLEAIYILGLVKGFRATNDLNMINHEMDYYYLKGEFLYSDEEKESNDDLKSLDENKRIFEIGFQKEKSKQLKIDKIIIPKLSEYIGQIKIVVFLKSRY